MADLQETTTTQTETAPDPASSDIPPEHARGGAQKRRDPSEPAAVVGLGASAGGVGVLQQFFGEMPNESGLAFVVVMHLAPNHESNLASILQQRTRMPVTQVSEAVKVQPNHVYVIPPNKQLTFQDSTLFLVDPQQGVGRRVTIDLFFRTLAQSFGQRSVSIILSGSDSDGVIGLKHVRAQGGVTIAQDPGEAEHDSMPVAAIGTGMVDWVLPVSQMPNKLMEYVRNEHAMRLPPEIPEAPEPDAKERQAPGGETVSDETRDAADEEALSEVLAHLRAHTAHDFTHYKRATVLRRIARRMQVNSIESIPNYLQLLRKHPAEASALLSDLLIGVTHFFRDRDAFAALEAHVPQLFAGKDRHSQVRVWVPGCATGEEAYSIAMLLCEYAERLPSPPKVQVFASDIDEQAIQDARHAFYPSTIEADVTLERLRQFFVKDHGHYRVRKELREMVLFAVHDVMRDAPFSRVDLISCRNLLIYLNEKAQDQLFDIFHFALRAGGLLFIGSAEGGQAAQSLFSAVDGRNRLYVRRSVPRPAWKLPLVPLRTPDPKPLSSAPRPRYLAALKADAVEKAGGESQQQTFDRQERRAVLFGELHLRLLEEYGPPSAVVNETHDLVHLSGKAGRYLQFVAGEPSANVIALVRPELRSEVRTALFRAGQTGESVAGSPIELQIAGESETVAIKVRPVKAKDSAHGYFLILFQRVEATATQAPAPEDPETASVVTELENEIQFLKQQLNNTVEQYEATSEELKASNEELQAMNEEMRSATEELETSKEELQSVNEELVTVNNELKSSVEDLSRSNTDLNNLMASTDIGTVFLDRQLRISRFTPSAQKLFNLIASDLGRPLSDITHKLNYPDFIRDADLVLSELKTIEHEVRVGEARWFLSRIAPYRTSENRIAGVVATFIDITARKEAENALVENEARMRKLADAIPQLIWTNDARGEANYFNLRWYEFTGLTYEQSRGPGWQAVVHPEDAAGSNARWMRALEKGEVFDTEYRLRGKDGEYRWFIGRNIPMRDEDGRVTSWFGSATDIDQLKEAEAAKRESEERFRLLVEGAKDYAMFLLDPSNNITFWSDGAERLFGWTEKEAIGKKGEIIFTPEDRQRGAVEKELGIAAEHGRAPDRRWHLRKDGTRLWLDGVMRRIDGRDGAIRGFAKVARDATDIREAEDQLRYARDQMEQRVLERTADLMAINNELEQTICEREQLERDLLEISERERRRIGQDLHDVVCQELTATALFLRSTANKIDNDDAAKTLSDAAQIVNRNVAIARDLARGFQPTDLRAGGLLEALRGLCKHASEVPHIHCSLKLPKSVRIRDEVVALNLYRIAQEAVRNAVTHSGGDEIVICIERERDLVRMVVEDNGKGFRPSKGKRSRKGLGLHIMKYRANVLGGTLMIDARPKGGTKVTCEVPMKATTARRKRRSSA